MQIATETERKYDVPEGFELPSLTGSAGIRSAGTAETHDLDATYFDTDELSLMRNRRTLRRRTGGHDAGWHLKTPAEAGSRREHRLPLGTSNGEVPVELRKQVRAIIRRRPLQPVAELRTHRIETPLEDESGRTLALVAQDRVTAVVDGEEQRWQEIEVELVDGDAKVLDAVERKLFAAGARAAAGPSKVARALGDRAPVSDPNGKIKVNPVLRYAKEQRDDLNRFDPGVRRGEGEAVHKMRVATRRLRSCLKTFKRTFGDADEVRDELKWLAGLLGEVRDGQVLSGKLLEGVEFPDVAARVREHLGAQVERGQAALDEALESERYLVLLDRIDRLVDRTPRVENDPLRRVRRDLEKADDLLDQAVAAGQDHELHEARKAYKRARYAVEVFQPTVGRPAKQLVGALTDLQDVLGAHQDSVVARELLEQWGSDSFHFGILWARQEQVGRETYAQLPVVVETSRKRKLRKWLG
ncbi:CHAD domain-containing protein [Actinoplanes sp. NPDC051343]|uniref:CYTH and CHAD domain-containing protein n=1 Tax=Actinoplanes sp. NPDC051343 TaxID=3363906 RepID=UPI0037B2B01D